MPKCLAEIFDVRYGHSLELNALEQTTQANGVAFVSRKSSRNGIAAYVDPIDGVEPAHAGEITCALGGAVLATYVQEADFYCGRDVAILRPRIPLTKQQILFYCHCIKTNRYRYSYGRQANKTLNKLIIPSVDEIPEWVASIDLDQISDAKNPVNTKPISEIATKAWSVFRYDALFDIKKGQRLTKNDMSDGDTPFIGAIDSNNGYRQFVNAIPNHKAGTITVSYNGSVGEAFYQSAPFWASDDVNVLYPKFAINPYIGLFFCAIIRKEKFRYSYGRKWNLERMKESNIRLPTLASGELDFTFMEEYIKSLPYSNSIQEVS
jgi:hypothetical protein